MLRSQDRIRSRAATGIRHRWVVTKQVCSSRKCTRASQEAELEEPSQGQNHSSSSQGTDITAGQQQCSTGGARGKASAENSCQEAGGQACASVFLHSSPYQWRLVGLGHSQLCSRRRFAQGPDKEVPFFHACLEIQFSPLSPTLFDR